ncbi:MAG: prolyl oligopeptidase family serine peptidase, partial [Thermoanaerobaculia bacterium]
MKKILFFGIFFIFSGLILPQKVEGKVEIKDEEDVYLWLEDIEGEEALSWVKEQNKITSKKIEKKKGFKKLEEELLNILNSKERIPYISKNCNFFYNFWKDEKNPRGIWRRTTLEEYKKKEPEWEIIIDLDELNKKEKVNWVWEGADILEPECKRALVYLSRGGADANVVREFDIEKKEFLKDGFQIPEAKGSISWIDEDNVYVATDFGPDTLTNSGYPRIVKEWKRGSPLEDAKVIFEGKKEDVSVGAYYDDTKGFERHFVSRSIYFYESEIFLREKDGNLIKIEVPLSAEVSVHREWLTVRLRESWKIEEKEYKEGSLLAIKFEEFLKGKRDFKVLFEPTPNISLDYYIWTKNFLILNTLEDVKNRLWLLTPSEGEWKKEPFHQNFKFSSISIWAVDEKESDDYFLSVSDYLTPSSLYIGKIVGGIEKLKEAPSFFASKNLQISQHFAKSKDGTTIPYFQVSPKNLKLNGKNKTLLTGYGGFEVSLKPYYSGIIGKGWLERGGVYVVANIRGGGEYGPKWHRTAIKENRIRAYEDFAAVAEDLIERKVTSPQYLGIEGGSNGGLLVGNMLVKYPHLFGAVVCQVPLLDMKRYTKLSAGASWIAEYGDPEKEEEWEFIKNFSPYHNLKENTKYPPVLFMTSTRDDRVHPGHSRKMAYKMLDMGYNVLYYENIEGGHGGAADNRQAAHMW